MQGITNKPGLHPMLWVAAIAITLFSLVGIAALTGLLPKSPPKTEEVATLQEASPPLTKTEPVPPEAQPIRPTEETAAPSPSRRTASASRQPATASSQDETRTGGATTYPNPTPVALCASCGVIESVRTVSAKGEGTGLGAIAGGVVGGALGHQVGKGSGNTLATIAGAVAGGYAGHQVEKNVRTSTQYEIAIRMDDGSRRVLTRKTQPSWRQGDRVEVSPEGEISAAPQGNSGRASF